MSDFDDFAALMLEESKRFLEKANDGNEPAYLHASIMLCMASLEAHVNAIASDFVERQDLGTHDRGILLEQEVHLKGGVFELRKNLKMYRLDERIEFIYTRLSTKRLEKSTGPWPGVMAAIELRNSLTHPKSPVEIDKARVERAILAVIELLDVLYEAIYQRPFPPKGRRTDSKLNF